MRIAVLSTWHPSPPYNGSKLRAQYLIGALAQEHRVTLVSFRPHGETKIGSCGDRLDQVESLNDDPFRNVHLPPVVRFVSMTPLVYWPNRSFSELVQRVCGAVVWDAVVILQVPTARYGLDLSAFARVADFDTALAYQMAERLKVTSGALARFRAWVSWQKASSYERRILRQFDLALAASATEVVPMRKLLGSYPPVDLLENGVDCIFNRYEPSSSTSPRLIFNGSLTYRANYDAISWFLEQIYPIIQSARPKIALHITGSTEGVNLSGLRLDNSVVLTGYLTDIRASVAGSGVCVVPVRQGGGTRLKILEAMALGTPVVTTTKGAEGLEVIDGEHLLLADTPQAFASAVINLLTDVDVRVRITQNARTLVETRYDWSTIGERFVHLVEKTVDERRKSSSCDTWGQH